MRILLLLPSLLSVVLVGCAGDFSRWRYDNPEIRKLQKTETERHISDGGAKTAIRDHIGARVGIVSIGSGDKPESSAYGVPAGGRAAALTGDGYFLTAWHVVRDKAFFIEMKVLEKRYPGRLVWCDPDVDLALVKIGSIGGACFKKMNVSPQPGEVVFSADRKGRGILVPNEKGIYDFRNFIGNGPFFAAGKILESKRRDSKPASHETVTSLVARGGMSGAPLVTADRELCGIITKVEWSLFRTRFRTVAMMIDPDFLFDVIEKDRKKSDGFSPPPSSVLKR